MECPGVPATYTFLVKPRPTGSADSIRQFICSGGSATIHLQSNVTGTTFSYSAIAANGHVTGFTPSCTSSCGSTITSTYSLESGYYQRDSVIYTITPNADGCSGTDFISKVIVKPNPNVTFDPSSTTGICTNETTNIILGSGVTSGVSYTWTNPVIVPAGSVTGASSCSSSCGTSIQQPLANTGNVTSTVTYAVTASAYGCTGDPNSFTLDVFPVPHVTNTDTAHAICSGTSAEINLTSNVTVPPTTFSWEASSPNSSYISGYFNGSGSSIDQVLTNTGTVDGVVIYHVVASANGCDGDTTTFRITVHPVPHVSLSQNEQEICSGATTLQVDFSCLVANTDYSWVAVASNPDSITGFDPSGNTDYIRPQTISSISIYPGTVTFTITPNANGCDGPDSTVVFTINPAPTVTNDPPEQTHCSGEPTNLVTLTSNVQGATFTWVAYASSTDITGFDPAGTSTINVQTIYNSGTTVGTVTYVIVPSFPGASECPGDTAEYIISIKPLPILAMDPLDTSICAGTEATINLSSSITGTSYTWVASQVGGVTGMQSCTGLSGACGDQILQTLELNSGIWIPGTATYTITPEFDGCAGDSGDTSIIVKPLPNVHFTPAYTAICSGGTTSIQLSTDVPSGATFAWTATLVQGTVTGFSDGAGEQIAHTLVNTGYDIGLIRYDVIATSSACPGDTFSNTVTVYPVPDVSNQPMTKAICSNTSTDIALTSNVSGTTFSWTASSTDAYISGYNSGAGLLIDQTLINTGDIDGSVTYTITPQANGCDGIDTSFIVTVHPIPVAHCDTSEQEICSGNPTIPVNLSSNVAGTIYTWTGVASSDSITNFTASGTGSTIPSQPNITSSSTTQGTVIYTVYPEANGCQGDTDTHTITVNPSPGVNNDPLTQTICSQWSSTLVTLTSNVPGTTFTWEATASSTSLSGFDESGTSTIPAQIITNSDIVPQTVTYHIVPHFTGVTSCAGDTAEYTIVVNPKPQVTSVLFDSVCSENPFSYTITSSIANSTFFWSRALVTGISNLATNGATSHILETLYNTTAADVDVTYKLLTTGPGAPACPSDTALLLLRVKDYFVDAGADFEIPHGISTDLNGNASGGGDHLAYTWEPQTLIQTGLHTLHPHTKNIYQDTTFYLVVHDQAMTNCTKTDSVRITLNGSALAADPTVDPPLVCPCTQAQLAANASGGSGTYTSYTWSASVGAPPVPMTADSPYIHPCVPTTYTVIVNDGYNTAQGSVSIDIKDPPVVHTVIGGGSYCAGDSGVTIGLNGTTLGDTYQLWHNGSTASPVMNGTGDSITFGTYLDPGLYTATATSVSQPQCTIDMAGSATVSIIPLPTLFSVTGGGSYSQGGTGVEIGLSGSQTTVEYELIYNDTLVIPPRITGTGSSIGFGYQTLGGTYTVVAYTLTDPVCSVQMLDSAVVIVNPWPTVYPLRGGGEVCEDDSTGVPIWLEDSEIGITYRLYRNGVQFGDTVIGTDDSLFITYSNRDGMYWATGTNQITGLMKYMDDTVTIVVNPLPIVYIMGSYGDQCPGTEIMLNGSQLGANYELQLDQTPIDTMAGTGTVLNFEPQYTPGVYRIRAYFVLTGCDTLMDNPITLHPAPEVFDVRPPGVSCAGDEVYITGSQTGILYQLQRDGSFNVGDPQPGTGDSINFGPQTVPGTYTVLAFNPLTNCNILMNGEANLNPVPDTFNVVPSGDTCAGVSIGLNGSQDQVKYILKRDTLWLDTINGTGFPIEFGPQTIPGIYTIVGYDTTTYKFCSALMLGSTIIHPNPIPYQIIPMGYSCAGDSIGLMDSDTGIVYQLIRNGTTAVGPLVSGTGEAIYFGIQTLPGTYTIVGKNPLTNCWNDMEGSSILTAIPISYVMTPGGDTCSGTAIGLNWSQMGVNYILLRDDIPVMTKPGTGGVLSFGYQTIAGTYYINGYNTTPDSCQNMMTDSTIIHQGPDLFNVIPAGLSCAGDSIGLDSSQTGILYQLVRNGTTNVGDPIPGNGSEISFGYQFVPGNYTVIAIDPLTSCWSQMNDSAVFIPVPAQYLMNPVGDTCAQAIITLNGSQTGVNYLLMRDGTFVVMTKQGTGSGLSFGTQSFSGTYTIRAVNLSADSCDLLMQGSLTIHNKPDVHNVIPNGSICTGNSIMLDHSEPGIAYQLFLNATIIDTLYGDGSQLNYGPQFLPGTYNILAIDTASGCWENMHGATVMFLEPTLYSIRPQSDTCEHIPVGLNGSDAGMEYILKRDGVPVDTMAGTGDPITFPYITTAGTYTVFGRSSLSDSCSAMMLGSLVITPIPVAYTLMPPGQNCEPTLLFLNHSQAGVEYRLIKDGIPFGPWVPSPGGGMLPFGSQMSGVYQAIGRYLNTQCADTMTGTVVVTAQPGSFAGNDTSVCYGYDITLTGSATSYSTVLWITRGDGVFTPNTSLVTNYQPGTQDLIQGSVWLILQVTGTEPCGYTTAKDSLLLTIDPLPIADAGPNDTICEASDASLTGFVQHASMSRWRTDGDGNFADPFQPVTSYTPGSTDLANGSVQLTLTAYGDLACTDTINDSMILFIQPLPIADAGADDTICESFTYTMNGSILHSTSVQWSTLGSGSFNDPTLLHAIYTPGAGDIPPGSVDLVLTAYGVESCLYASTQDTMTLWFNLLPIISAGPDTTICANQQYTLIPTSAQFASAVHWSTVGGEGQFDQPDSLHPTYIPGVADTTNGFVLLVLQATGTAYCSSETVTDTLQLSFHSAPVALAGEDLDGCPNEPLTVPGDAYHYSTVLWETTGDGSFSDQTQLITLYTAGTGDKAAGFVDLILTVNGTAECIDETDSDTVHVTYQPLPTAQLAGWDTICEGDTAYLPLHLTGHAPWTIQLFDGITTTTITGIDTAFYLVPVTPETTVSYTITGVSDLYCTGEEFTGGSIVVVNPTPSEYQIIAPNGGLYCEGGTGIEIGIDGSELGFAYQLLLNSQPIGSLTYGTGDSLIFGIFIPAGIYTVYATNPSTNCGILFSDSLTVLVMPLPNVDFSADSSCYGDTTYFYLTGTDIGRVSEWTWNFGDGTWVTYNTPVNPTHAYFGTSTYYVTLFALDTNGCTKTVSHFVSVSTPPIANFGYSPGACVDHQVQFTDYSVTMNSDYLSQWKWEFGDGTDTTIYCPNDPNISHTYNTSGEKTVILTVTTSGGCEDTVSYHVIIYQNPSADFTYSTTRCTGDPVQFTDQSQTNGGTSVIGWYWNFNDPGSGSNNTSSAQHPTHTFSLPGSYNVMLVVSNVTGCSDTITKTVSISDAPVANFEADTACKGNPTHFTDLSTTSQGNIVSWEWDFGDGSPHNYLQTVEHTYTNTGIYTVTLTVSNTSGCYDLISRPVLVTTGPTAGFIVTTGNCAGALVSFLDQSVPNHGYLVNWIWDFGDGTTTTIHYPDPQNVDHIYTNPGTYDVVLTVENSDSCMDSYQQSITIAPKPTADFTYPEERCEDFGIQFEDLSLPGRSGIISSWSWNFGDPGSGTSNISNLQNPIHIFLNAGDYDVTLIVTNLNGCKDTVVKTVPIDSRPVVSFTADTVCRGNPTTFTDYSTTNSGTNVAWAWDFGDGSTSNLQNPTHLYTNAGTYAVTLVVTNSVNCDNDTTINVLVRELPWVMFTSEDNCFGTESYFFDESLAYYGVITNWDWDFGDGNTSTDPDPVHLYDAPGTYDVQLIITTSYSCQDSITLPHTVYENPSAAFYYTNSFCPAGKVFFNDNSTTYGTNIASWQWIFEGQEGSTLPNPVYTYSILDTTYDVTLIVEDQHGCIDTTIQPVYVHPAFEFTFTTETECAGQPTQFNPVNLAEGDSLLSIVWRFGDPASGSNNYSTLYNPTHIYSSSGSYWVRMRATNSDYCVDSIWKEIQIQQGPLADFSYDSLPHCDSTMIFENLSVGIGVPIDSLLWDFGDGSTLVNYPPLPGTVTHQFPNFGIYTIALTAYSPSGCENQILMPVIISCIHAAIEQPDTLFCSSEPALFLDGSTPVELISSWQWDFGDGGDTLYLQHTDSIYHYYSTPGHYLVSLVITSPASGGSTVTDTTWRSLSILPTSIADFHANPVCYLDTTQFLNLTDSNGVLITGINWNFGDPGSGSGNYSSLVQPRHYYHQPGIYQATLEIENANGCTDSITKQVVVHHLPEAAISASLACSRHYAYFTDISLPGDTLISSWFWIFGDPHTPLDTSTFQHPYYSYHDPGGYTVFLKTEDDFGCSDTTNFELNVLPSPISAFTIQENIDGIPGRIQLFNFSVNAVTYEWDYGDGHVEYEEEPLPYEYEEEGNYLIKLITQAANSCTDTSFYPLELLFKGLFIPNAFSPTNINPNSRVFKPKGVNIRLYHIQVFDVWGTLLWESTKVDPQGRPVEEWDGTYKGKLLPQGVYMWKASATFTDGSDWEGNDIGEGEPSRMGTVAIIR